jgi:hypothetical protein
MNSTSNANDIQLLEKILFQHNDFISKKQLLTKFNNHLSSRDLKTVTMRTLDRRIKDMEATEYEFEKEFNGHERVFKLSYIPNKSILSQEEINTFPLVYGSFESEENMPTVKKIKELLLDEFGFSSQDLKDERYFVKAEPEITNHNKIILLAGKLIYHAKNGMAIKYWYTNKAGIQDSKYIAPIQVRLYDYRYYLLGLDMDSETGIASNILKNYCLDTILDYKIETAYIETIDGLGEPKLLKFNHQELYTKSELEYKLKHCIGVWYDEKNTLNVLKLKFYDWAVGIVLNKKLHHSQKTIEKKDNYVIIQISVWDNHEIDFALGRFGDKCERLN